MRLKSSLWVSAYLRRCNGAGLFAAVVQRGAEEAGAIFIKINRLDGTADLFAPAPQSMIDDMAVARSFSCVTAAGADPDVDAYLARQRKFDPDLWIIEVEDRAGRHFIDDVVA